MVHKEVSPLVSVVMSVFNGAAFLPEAIESILAQSIADLEFIIINDGSTDNSEQIISSYTDSRINLVSNDSNLGLANSLNRGFKMANGKYIARQDADDLSMPERLERQVRFLEENKNIKLVGTGSRWVNAKGELQREWNPPVNPAEIQQKILRGLPVLHATILFHRECLTLLDGPYDESFPVAQDTDFLFRFSEIYDVSNINQAMYIVRQHASSTTANRQDDQLAFLKVAQLKAVRRRLNLGWGRVRPFNTTLPTWIHAADRSWLANRYVWWSACTRSHSKWSALQMLIISFLLDPTTPDLWRFVKSVFVRKIGIDKEAEQQASFV